VTESPLKCAARYSLAALFVGTGAYHFANPGFYVRIMPPYLSRHYELVLLSGALEILGGVGLLVPRARRTAAWGLIALLIAVFPANVYMATNAHLFPEVPDAVLWARLPFQAVFVAWAFWFARR